jgi:peptidyl-prolyl cis-trans isomerase D
MLSIMRKQARSWMIKIILLAIVIVFVLWGITGYDAPQETTVAQVNGEPISFKAYRQNYDRMREQYRQAYGGSLDENMLRAFRLNEQALNQLIDRVLMLQEAKRLNIQIADSTLDQAIVAFPAFQTDGAFDEDRAGFILAQNRMTTTDFRNVYREDLMIEKLRALVLEGVTVSEAEAREWYDWYNAKVDLNYFLFDHARYADIAPSDEQISAYFQENAENYRTEPKIQVSFLHLDPADYKDQVSISDEQISVYYFDHPNEFATEKTVEARHIIFLADENAEEQVVADKLKEAMAVYEKAVAGEPFDELAKTYSEGPTRDEGGYLGAFKKGDMVAPFADKAFSMQAGEVSEPVRTRFGWHIIKVEKVNPAEQRSLEAAADSIRDNLMAEAARSLARRKAEEIHDNTFDGDDLAVAAENYQMPLETTDFFSSGQLPLLEGVTNARAFVRLAFGLEPMSVSEPLELENGYYVLQVVDRIDAAVPSLEEVKEKVKADLTAKLRDERAKADAQIALADLQQGKSLADISAAFDLAPMQTGFFTRTEAIPQISHDPDMLQAAFMLQEDQPLAEKVFKGSQGWFVIQLNERRKPDEEGFVEQKENILQQLPEQKKKTVFDQWLADLKARGNIKIEDAMIQ